MLSIASLALLSTIFATGDEWPQFRGPGGRAVASSASIPASFGPEENLLWKADLPPGHSSPCVVGKRIFVTGCDGPKNEVLALDRESGEVLWKKEFVGAEHGAYFHADAVPGVSTPACDGERVVAYLGNYGLVALDLDGKILWEKRMEHPGYGFGVGPSILLYEGLLFVPRDGAPEAALLALDASDGSELWRVDRFDFGESHGSPFLWSNADRDELVVSGTNRLSSYHPGTGDLLWSLAGTTSFPCTTPTADDDTLYFAAWSTPNATGRSFWEGAFARSLELSDAEVADPALLFARLDKNGDGKVVEDEVPECRAKDAFGFLDRNRNGTWEVDELVSAGDQGATGGKNVMVAVARGAEGDATDKVRWSWTRGLPYVASPLLYRSRIWLFKSGGLVTALQARTGEPAINRSRLDDRSEYYLSPVGAGGYVIAGSAEGTLYLLDAEASELKVVHSVEFGEELFATPAVVDGQVFVRTKSTLWAFGE